MDLTNNVGAEMLCEICGGDRALITLGRRDSDGSYFEQTDGSFGDSDLHVCIDCAGEALEELED